MASSDDRGSDDTLPASGAVAPTQVGHVGITAPGTDATLAAPIRPTPPPAGDYPKLIAIDPQHYVRGKEIARGGMGRIVTARDRRLGRTVALKELFIDSSELAARFEREARITAKLQHPAIVNLLEAGTWPSGEPFYAMKLVSGESLDKAIAKRETLADRLGLLPTVIAVVDALAYAHANRVIHRDLKPANVLVGEFGETVVIDWGLAKDLGEPGEPGESVGSLRVAGAPGETVAGAVMGTPAYMPPEQAKGAAVDERADVYALGALLYHVLGGAAPFTGRTVDEIIGRVIEGTRAPLGADVPADLVTIVDKAMARDAADRYPTAKELAADLKSFQTGQLVGAHRYSTWQLIRRWIRKHRTAVTVAAIATIALAVLGVVSFRGIQQQRAVAEERLADVLRLSDAKRVRDLVEQADALWPPATAGAMETWMRDARVVLANRDGHVAALGRLPPSPSTPELEWQRSVLTDIIGGLDRIDRELLGAIAKRYELASTLSQRSIEHPAWRDTIAAIASSPRYHGLKLSPQLGLVPLGRDPKSQLFEFAVLDTGSVPSRDATGRLAIADDSAIVLVLIPSGTFAMGAQRDPAKPNYDPDAQQSESPVHDVELSAFFLAKYECTQAQWKTMTGADPSQYKAGQVVAERTLTLRDPVEQVSWDEVTRWTKRYGLALPTESQWEYACRAETQTPRYASLATIANLADAYLAAHGGPTNWQITRDVDDGHYTHAPVGSYAPSSFGLHDMLGNVYEWTADWHAPYPDALVRDPVGPPTGEIRVGRGGSWSDAAPGLRASARTRDAPGTRNDSLGFRAARAIQR